MTAEQRHDALVAAMQRLFELPAAQLRPEARLQEDLDIDSIDAVNLVIELRRLSGRQIGAEQFRDVRTFADVEQAFERVLADPSTSADANGGVASGPAADESPSARR